MMPNGELSSTCPLPPRGEAQVGTVQDDIARVVHVRAAIGYVREIKLSGANAIRFKKNTR